jgi:hypothetical protein
LPPAGLRRARALPCTRERDALSTAKLDYLFMVIMRY